MEVCALHKECGSLKVGGDLGPPVNDSAALTFRNLALRLETTVPALPPALIY